MQIGFRPFTSQASAKAFRNRLYACTARHASHQVRIAMLAVALCVAPALFAQSGWDTQTAQSAQTSYTRLGVPEVLSALGSPLWVKIPVEATGATAEIAASSFSLGSRPENAGIPFLENAEITFERQGGKYFLVIRSRQPVNELAIGLVIREQLTRGIRSREFSVLVDPPALFEARAAERASEPAQIAATAPALPVQVQPVRAPRSVVPPLLTAANAPRKPRSRKSSPVLGYSTSRAAAVANGVPANPANNVAKNKRIEKARAEANAAARKAKPDPPLRLSLSAENLGALPTANEATRTELRRRQLILDTDDLTSALLDRNHKIGLLEKELASLAARISAAERSLNITRLPPAVEGATSVANASNVALPNGANMVLAPAVQTATPPAVETPVAVSAPANLEIVKSGPAMLKPVQATTPQRSLTLSTLVMLSIAGLCLLGAAVSVIRRRTRARQDAIRIAAAAAAGPVMVEGANKTIPLRPRILSKVEPDTTHPDTYFELPDLAVADETTPASSTMSPTTATVGPPGTVFHQPSVAANAENSAGAADTRGRRVRYLQSRYEDIAILKPPLDAPQRLLRQAGHLHAEGAVDYAKRLLKYAAYSRPYAEEYWLALFELLYREKFANDYQVSAKWFREYHPNSENWNEVQRIGYMLNPSAAIFVSAAAWSHEEPAIGVWLPANQPDAHSLVAPPKLKLELAK